MTNYPMRTKQSLWVPSDVQKWGWTVQSDQNVEVSNDKTSGLEAALKVLQISSSNSMSVRIKHNQDVKVDKNGYPATDAEYCAVYSPVEGGNLCFRSTQPKLPQVNLEPLDWYPLSSANKEQQSPLRYIFVRGIINRATQQLITEAMRADGYKSKEVLPWPNFWMFTPHDNGKISDPFLSVLGTENFAGIAPLLAQHQHAFGKKLIHSVRTWGDGGMSPVLHGMVELH